MNPGGQYDNPQERTNARATSFSQSTSYRSQDYYSLNDPQRFALQVGPPQPAPRQFVDERAYTGPYRHPIDDSDIYNDNTRHGGAGGYSAREPIFQRHPPHSTPLNMLHMPYHGHTPTSTGYTRPDFPNHNHQKRNNFLDDFPMGGSLPTLQTEPDSSLPGPSSEHSGDSDYRSSSRPEVSPVSPSEPPKARKPRREKPRIDLAPDQPPTTQGKPRARVYVACLQCRTRKIRCDGAKPTCHNCGRRASEGSECNYDALPKRRGPDRTPGARQRMARDLRNEIEDGPPRRRRRTRANPASASDVPKTQPTQPTSLNSPQAQTPVTTSAFPLEILPKSPTDSAYVNEGSLPSQDLKRRQPPTHMASTSAPRGHEPMRSATPPPTNSPASPSDLGYSTHNFGPAHYQGFRQRSTSNLPLLSSQAQFPDANANPPMSLSSSSPSDLSYTTADFVTNQNYPRSSYSPCRCHGLANCPDNGGPLDPRKPTPSIQTFHDAYDRATMARPHGTSRGYLVEVNENGKERQVGESPVMVDEPNLEFSRKVWWDSLLSLYISPTSTRLQTLSVAQRESGAQRITSDLRFVFRTANYWFSFFHVPTFFANFFDPNGRESVQPSLVLALLAMATFWQSSELGMGHEGRERALRFRDEAQAAMDASLNAGWIDETLAQAAWLLALFEVCAHPRHSTERSTSAMFMLDSIIRYLSLTFVDRDDPNATMFSPGMVPVLKEAQKTTAGILDPFVPPSADSYEPYSIAGLDSQNGCSCHMVTLNRHWPSASVHAPLWASTPAWDPSWSEGEIRKESCRRLCWSSMVLAAGHVSYTTAQRSESVDLWISDPANYTLLFSGEAVARSPMLRGQSFKNTIWALYDRTYLLWHGCMRMRLNYHVTDEDKAQFAVKAWLEADSLEKALNRHTCSIEKAFLYQAREYIFNTRMCISYEFQRYVPLVTANMSGLFHRDKAEDWLTHEINVAKRFMDGLSTITGIANNFLARRPFFVFWFMGQIHRALTLWHCDNSLKIALMLCKSLIPAIDYLTALWPCPEQRHRYKLLRQELEQACFVAGVEAPPPMRLFSGTLPESLATLV